LRRVEEEERAAQAPVYGGPPPRDDRPAPDHDEPAPVYGGPPPFNAGRSITRRRSLWGLLLAALAAIVGIIALLIKGRRIFPQENSHAGPQAPVYGGPPIPLPQPRVEEPTHQTLTLAIQTHNGHLLTAVNGGGLGNPKSAPRGVALTTGATTAGPLETFTLVWVNKSERTFALKTHDGHFVTAVNGGGIGGPDSVKSPVHANVTTFAPWAKFTITMLPDDIHATIRTADGKHFVSAVQGGGVGGSNEIPIRTDAGTMTPEAVFRVVPAKPPANLPPAAVYGGPVPRPRS
jgi:hypothetical protein